MHSLTADSPILLEFDDEVHVFSFGTLCLMSERFMVQVAANLVPIQYDDPRARVRLMLYRSDGKSSWGGSCPLRPRDP